MKTSILALALLAAAAFSTPSLRADAPTSQPAAANTYPLEVCVVSGEKLGGDMGPAVVETIDGREVHFCCKNCPAEFKKDLAASNKKMDAMIVAAQKDKYPLKTCVISGEKLGGDMGEPLMFVDHKSNSLIELCCKNCLKDVEKDPSAALAKIDAAAVAAH